MDNSSSFFLIVFLFLSFHPFCSVSSFSTFSISETSNRILVCALVKPPNSPQPSLNCSSFPSGIQIPQIHNVHNVSGVVAGDGFFCTLRFGSIINCWRFSVNGTDEPPKRIHKNSTLTQLEAGNSHFCGLFNGTNALWCWQWPEFNQSSAQRFSSIAVGGEFVCGLSETGEIGCLGNTTGSIRERPTGNNYRVISAGFRHACAINSSNDLNCWGDIDRMGVVPQGKFLALALGENRSCALRTNETVVCWGQNNFRLPDSLQKTYFIAIEAKRSVFCGVLSSNYSLFCWGNEIFDSNFMVFSDALPGSCENESQCPCGPLPGSSDRFCGSGQSICQSCQENITPQPEMRPTSPPSAPSPLPGSGSDLNGRMIAFLVVGCVGSSSMLLVIGFFLFRYCKGRGCRVHDSGRLDEEGATPEEGGASQPEPPLPPPQTPVLEKRLSQLTSIGTSHLEEFSLQVLLQVTNNFSEEHKIGTGSFGSVYHATLDDGREVAIKRAELSATSSYTVGKRQGQEDKDHAFVNELESLSRLHHKNLVRLLGFCEDCDERVLVYEYMSNGTLHDHLHKLQDSPLMSWVARIKVALDAARGIQYLHEFAVPPVIHRDIKSSNILLDGTGTAKVSDFGLSLMGPMEDEPHLPLRAAGTFGYMDPEYYRLQVLTSKSDVYSFGVLLLELLSGCKAIHRNENGVPRNVVDYVVPFIFKDEIHRVLDPRVPPPTPFEIEAVAHVGYIAADCVMQEGQDRPSMTAIVNSLERALLACLVHPSLSRSTTGRESVHSL